MSSPPLYLSRIVLETRSISIIVIIIIIIIIMTSIIISIMMCSRPGQYYLFTTSITFPKLD